MLQLALCRSQEGVQAGGICCLGNVLPSLIAVVFCFQTLGSGVQGCDAYSLIFNTVDVAV